MTARLGDASKKVLTPLAARAGAVAGDRVGRKASELIEQQLLPRLRQRPDETGPTDEVDEVDGAADEAEAVADQRVEQRRQRAQRRSQRQKASSH